MQYSFYYMMKCVKGSNEIVNSIIFDHTAPSGLQFFGSGLSKNRSFQNRKNLQNSKTADSSSFGQSIIESASSLMSP